MSILQKRDTLENNECSMLVIVHTLRKLRFLKQSIELRLL